MHRRIRLAGLLAAVAAIAVISHQSPASSSATGAPPLAPRRHVPVAGHLDPALVDALREAAAVATADGVGLVVDSGWRSPRYQERLRQEAIAKYGSEEEAARWVATPETSPHVAGDAVDVGPPEGAAWLSAHGAEYGLCQIYGNEPWHYELRPEAIEDGCPAMYPDPTHDPRMQP